MLPIFISPHFSPFYLASSIFLISFSGTTHVPTSEYKEWFAWYTRVGIAFENRNVKLFVGNDYEVQFAPGNCNFYFFICNFLFFIYLFLVFLFLFILFCEGLCMWLVSKCTTSSQRVGNDLLWKCYVQNLFRFNSYPSHSSFSFHSFHTNKILLNIIKYY